MNSRSVGIFAVVVAVIVGVSIWFLNSDYAPHAVPEAGSVTPAPAPVLAPKTTPDTTPSIPTPKAPENLAPVTPTPSTKPPVTITEDDQKIDNILRLYPGNTDTDHANTAQALINVLPSLTAEGQVEAISHISNVLSDEEYKRILPIWKNPGFNSDVLDAIFTDLMNRDDKVKLPALIDAVRLPNHPSHEEAKSTLEIFLDEDYGTDIAKWEKGVQDYLKKQAEEEAGNAK